MYPHSSFGGGDGGGDGFGDGGGDGFGDGGGDGFGSFGLQSGTAEPHAMQSLAVPAEQRPMVFLTFLMVLLIMKGRVHALSGNDYLYPFLLTYFVACILPDIHFAGYV